MGSLCRHSLSQLLIVAAACTEVNQFHSEAFTPRSNEKIDLCTPRPWRLKNNLTFRNTKVVKFFCCFRYGFAAVRTRSKAMGYAVGCPQPVSPLHRGGSALERPGRGGSTHRVHSRVFIPTCCMYGIGVDRVGVRVALGGPRAARVLAQPLLAGRQVAATSRRPPPPRLLLHRGLCFALPPPPHLILVRK